MTELVANCPRCRSKKITFDLTQQNYIYTHYSWQQWFEAFCVCRNCKEATIFVLSQNIDSDKSYVHEKGLMGIKGSVNNYMNIEGFISLKDTVSTLPPEHLPGNIEAAFKEGATCMSVLCFNSAGTIFRLCIDLATRSMLPDKDTQGLNASTRRFLGLRLPWLFNNKLLPEDLRELSSCIKDDGNDGAHEGNLNKEDAEDLLDFTYAILERIYSERERLRLAKERRDMRRRKNVSLNQVSS